MSAKLNLDKLDLQIIQEMMEDAEISYADLGKKLFVSGGTIHVRIKKLEELKVVKGKRLSVDLKLLGYDVIAFIGIYLEKSSLYDSVARELKKIPQIVRLNYTTGNYSMFAEIVCKVVGFEGEIIYDDSKPDGMPRKIMNSSKANQYGWTKNFSLLEGLKVTYEWFKATPDVRGMR